MTVPRRLVFRNNNSLPLTAEEVDDNFEYLNEYAGVVDAAANGSTDDGPALQAEIDRLEAEYGGGVIRLAARKYKIGTQVRIKKGVLLQGAMPAHTSSAGAVSNGATIFLCLTAFTPSILICSDTVGTYVEGGGIVGISFFGGNSGIRGVEARTVSGMTFDIWGEKFIDCLLEINGQNGGISRGNDVRKVIYRSGANVACTYSGGLRLNNTTVSRYGFIWTTVREGVGLDIYLTDASSFAHVQGGLQQDTDGGKKIVLRGAKYHVDRPILTHENNGSGAPRFTSYNHGLTTGQSINMTGWAVATTYNNVASIVTVIDNATFDVEALTYTAEAVSASTIFSRQVITGHADNGSGAPRFEAVSHGLWDGQGIALGGWVTATNYNENNLAVTVIDADHFDIESLTYTAESVSHLTQFSIHTHAARRNTFGFVAGYAPIHVEVSDAVGASHPAAFMTVNGEGQSITYDEDGSGQTGVVDYKVVDWPTGEIYQTRRWPMRDTLMLMTGEATLGSNAVRSVRSTGLMPSIELADAVAVTNNYAVWFKPPPHWGDGTITAARIRYSSNTDGANTFDIKFRVSPLPLEATASGGAIGTLHTFSLAAAGTNHIIKEHTVTLTEVYSKGDSILVYIARDGTADSSAVTFGIYSIELEYVSDGPPDHAPGTLDQTWFPSIDTAPVVT